MGSPREVLLLLLWLQKEQMEHAQTFALIQTMVDREKAGEAFESYKKIRFPWIESSKEKQKIDHIKKLMQEVKHGALNVTPMQQSRKVNSKLKRIVASRAPSEEIKKEQAKIYSKMGMSVPR